MADIPILPTHPTIPGRPVPEEGDARQQVIPPAPRRRRPRDQESDDEGGDARGRSDSSDRHNHNDDPDHIDEYA